MDKIKNAWKILKVIWARVDFERYCLVVVILSVFLNGVGLISNNVTLAGGTTLLLLGFVLKTPKVLRKSSKNKTIDEDGTV